MKSHINPPYVSLLVVVALAITTATSADPSASLIFSASWLAAVGGWWLAWGLGQYAPRMVQAVQYAGVAVGLAVAVQWLQGIERPAGLLAGPNLAAVVVAMAAVLAYATQPHPRRLWLGMAAYTVILFTGSRSGLFALIVGYMLVEWPDRRMEFRFLSVWWGWPLALVLGQVFLSLNREIAATVASNPAAAGQLFRWDFWEVAWQAWQARPWVGHGPGTYRTLWTAAHPEAFPYYAAHNLFAHVAAEQGLVGLGAWLAMLAAGAWRMATSWRNTAAQRALLGLVGVLAVHAMLDTPEWDVLLIAGALLVHWQRFGIAPPPGYNVS